MALNPSRLTSYLCAFARTRGFMFEVEKQEETPARRRGEARDGPPAPARPAVILNDSSGAGPR